MNIRAKAWVLALIIGAGLMLSMAQGAEASRLKAGLPPTKTPTSGRFDLTASIAIAIKDSSGASNSQNATIDVTGSGAFNRDSYQVDVTLKSSGGATAGAPSEIKYSTIVVGNKLYFKLSGVSPETDNKWYVADLSQVAGTLPTGTTGTTGTVGGTLPGMPTSAPAGLEEAYTSTPVGKETVSGVATTKYRIDVDLKKLYTLMGLPEKDAAELAKDLKMSMFLWIGDQDMYVYRMSLSEESNIPDGSGGISGSISLQLTMTYKDLDAPITITAPENAEPIDFSSTTGILPGMPSGMPIGMPVGMPVGMPGGTGMGMPKTGGSAENHDSVLWPLLSVSILLVMAGGIARRRATTLQ